MLLRSKAALRIPSTKLAFDKTMSAVMRNEEGGDGA
jgi:hypothetical protein